MNNDEKPKQKTPKGHEVPVPTREDFMHDLEKAAKPEEQLLLLGKGVYTAST